MKDQLRESEEIYRTLVDNINIGVSLISSDMEILTLNKQMKAWFPDIDDSTKPICYKAFNKPPREEICSYCPTCMTLKDGLLHEAVTETPTAGGTANFLVRSSPVKDANGNVVAAIEIVEDITARKHAEETCSLLASIVQNSDDAIIGKDLNDAIVSWNAKAESLFGYTESEIVGKPVTVLVPPEHVAETVDILEKVKEGRMVERHDSVRIAKDGTRLNVSITVSPIKDASGRVTGAATIARDISDLKRIEKMKNEFISTVSHELRTPLTSLRGSLGLLAGGVMGEFSDDVQELLVIARNNTDRLVRLINDILDLEKIESGKIKMEIHEVELEELVRKSIGEMTGFAEKHGVRVVCDVPSARVIGDSDRLLQVLDNLISNAVKFSPPGSEVLICAVKVFGRVTVFVQDCGSGIPARFRDRIFNKFQQADSSVTREKGGTGLGLAICKAIVESHGGEIWFESEEGNGTIFFFTLFSSEENAFLDIDKYPIEGTHGAGVHTSAARNRLLVVDDDPAILKLLRKVLEKGNYVIETAGDGRSAKALAVANPPDVIILDIGLPDQSGFEVMKFLKNESATRDVPVIVISGNSQENFHRPDSPHVDWLTKPMDLKRLLEAVGNATRVKAKPRVLIIDDDAELLKILKHMLTGKGINVETAATGRQAVGALKAAPPDLVIFEVMMQEGDGFYVSGKMRDDPALSGIPSVIYTCKDLTREERELLSGHDTRFFTKLKIGEEAFTDRIVELIGGLCEGGRKELETLNVN
jgi:PAS domain S-box-containing protein